ncbi:MAG TPA: AarF/ABC1/UbiB kinase family protein [Candidatus Saccharimonadales bacterium]|nr:AarF/ABC1/UbiB kinase family protein [Candidatus Saccharimonadales bacterium]
MASPDKSSIAAIKRHRTAKLATLGTRAYYLHRRGKDDEMYSLICDEMVELGGIYVKFLQGVLLQSQAMRSWRSNDRLKIFENLDHEPIDVVRVLQAELSSDKLAQISSIQPQPFAAGSFGQVYYGQHVNGKPVIIKVLRPMVKELLKYDLRLLGMFSRTMINKMSSNMDIDLNQAIKDFRIATLRETDYIAEANFAHELFEAYKGHANFVIPETFLDLCTSNVIVQEYIDGLSVAQLLRLKEQGVDPKRYIQETIGSNLDTQLEILGTELLDGIFNLTRVQGDPHPGNIRLMAGNKVGMIDFGIAAPVPDNKAAFFGIIAAWNKLYSDDFDLSTLFEQFMRFFVSDLYKALKRIGSFNQRNNMNSNGDDSNYTKALGRIAHETFKKSVGVSDIRPLLEDGRVFQLMNQMVNKNNRFGLVLKLEASEILRAVQTYITLVDALGRRNVVLPKVFSNVVERVEREHPELAHDNDDDLSVSQALDIVSKWLERVAIRDPALFRQLVNRIKLGSDKLGAIPSAQPVKKETTNA